MSVKRERNMWVIVLFALWGAELFPATMFGQEAVQQNNARLTHRFEEKVGRHRLDETLVSLADSIKEPGYRLALRICSKKPLSESVAIAALPPLSAFNFLVEAEGYKPER